MEARLRLNLISKNLGLMINQVYTYNSTVSDFERDIVVSNHQNIGSDKSQAIFKEIFREQNGKMQCSNNDRITRFSLHLVWGTATGVFS